MKKYFTILPLFLLAYTTLVAQIGSRYTYEFLSMPASARITALGGVAGLVVDNDINLGNNNVALLNEKTDGSIAFNHNFHFAGISNGNFSFGKFLPKQKVSCMLAFSYITYGDFQLSDEFGTVNGQFNASEKAVTLGVAKKLNERIDAGLQLKTIFSALETYKSFGLAGDASITYTNPIKNFIVGLMIKNAGSEISTYHSSPLSAPLDIQIAYSKRLNHLPLRFSIIGHQLQQWNVRYDDPNVVENSNILGESTEKSEFSKNVDNFFRHLIFNLELSLGKAENFKIRGAYNHFRRKELSLSTFRSMAGFSLGFGLKIKQFNLDYGVGYYHLAGAANHLSIATNINRFKNKI